MSLPLLPAFIVLWAIVLFQGLVILGLLRTVRALQVAIESGRIPQRLPVGAHSPRFTGTDLRAGAGVDSSELTGRELVVLFLSDGCTSCRRLADGTRQVPVEPGQARIAICQGGAREARTFMDLLASDVAVLADPDGAVFASFGISSTPSAVVVGETGVVLGSGGPQHSGELAALVSTARQPVVGGNQPLPATAR
jgi:peroxiredoxin